MIKPGQQAGSNGASDAEYVCGERGLGFEIAGGIDRSQSKKDHLTYQQGEKREDLGGKEIGPFYHVWLLE